MVMGSKVINKEEYKGFKKNMREAISMDILV